MVKEDFTWMSMGQYVSKFVEAYRREVELKGKSVIIFGRYQREVCLSRPCQVEVFWFENTYKRLWVFLFSKSLWDLKMNVRKASWQDMDEIILDLDNDYSDLGLNLPFLIKTFKFFKRPDKQRDDFLFDWSKNVFLIYFPRDPRLGTIIWQRLWNSASPETLANIIFNLIFTQTDMYYVMNSDWMERT
ncbi:MAG: hypothetical protein QXZ02_07225 [Candidatus Bathyarchaeia archaeon]